MEHVLRCHKCTVTEKNLLEESLTVHKFVKAEIPQEAGYVSRRDMKQAMYRRAKVRMKGSDS
jgi:hypothetical protein